MESTPICSLYDAYMYAHNITLNIRDIKKNQLCFNSTQSQPNIECLLTDSKSYQHLLWVIALIRFAYLFINLKCIHVYQTVSLSSCLAKKDPYVVYIRCVFT